MLSFQVTSEWCSELFNDAKHHAASLWQFSFSEWCSELFNDAKHHAASLWQLSFSEWRSELFNDAKHHAASLWQLSFSEWRTKHHAASLWQLSFSEWRTKHHAASLWQLSFLYNLLTQIAHEFINYMHHLVVEINLTASCSHCHRSTMSDSSAVDDSTMAACHGFTHLVTDDKLIPSSNCLCHVITATDI